MDNIKKITHPIRPELDIFEKSLENLLFENKNFLYEDIKSFMFSNQKRLRPIFVYLFSKILGINSPLVEKIALALELIHSSSLIHDDIIDEAETRRNNKTLHTKYNTKLAVLEGDMLLSLSLEVLSQTTLEIVKIFSDKIKKTIQGEIGQNENLYKITDMDEYFKKTLNKTGNLFLAGLESVLSLGDFDGVIKSSLFDFVFNYSIAFQIKNDIKDIKSDTKNGNYTLVMLYFVMEENIEKFNSSNLEKYISRANLTLREYRDKALFALDKLENSKYKKVLEELTLYTLGE